MTVEAISHMSHILVMAWTIDNVSKLIEEIEARPIIWNVREIVVSVTDALSREWHISRIHLRYIGTDTLQDYLHILSCHPQEFSELEWNLQH